MIAIARTETVSSEAGRGMPIPWWAKIGAKLVLGRLPISYDAWRALGVFRHGRVDIHPERVFATMQRGWEHYRRINAAEPTVCLELGPGDSIAGAMKAASVGARSIMVDVGDFATRDMESYRAAAALLGATELDFSSFEALLASCRAQYLTGGLASLKTLPATCVDLAVSTSVIEHVKLAEFDETLSELYRVMRPGAVASHMIDFMDHLGGGLNNLRFSAALWERRDFAAMGFYTNRLRPSQIVERARNAGFDVDLSWAALWPAAPLARSAMAPEFASLADFDLTVALADVVMIRR